MARYTGRDLVVLWINPAGTTNLSADERNLAVTEDVDAADSTAHDDTYAHSIPTFTNAVATLQLLDTTGATGTAQWDAVEPRTEGTLQWGPAGSASGSQKHSAPAWVQSRSRDIPYADVVSMEIGFQFTDEPTDSSWT